MQNENIIKNFIFQGFAFFILLTNVFSGAASVAAQTRRQTSAANNKTAQTCQNCWSGIVTYKKIYEENIFQDTPVFGTLDPKNEHRVEDVKTKKKYVGTAVISDGGSGAITTKAAAFFSYSENHEATQSEWVRCHSHEDDKIRSETRKYHYQTGGSGSGEAEGYNFRIYEGNYHFSFKFPEFESEGDYKSLTTRTGLCPGSEKRSSEGNSEEYFLRVSRETVSIDERIDPKNPNVIAGTKTWIETDSTNTQKTTYVIQWKFQHKLKPLMVTGIRFYRALDYTQDTWIEIGSADYAAKGEKIKIVASIYNNSGEQQWDTVKFRELKGSLNLPDGEVNATFLPKELREVELIWDTSGGTLTDAIRQIEVSVSEDSLSRELQLLSK